MKCPMCSEEKDIDIAVDKLDSQTLFCKKCKTWWEQQKQPMFSGPTETSKKAYHNLTADFKDTQSSMVFKYIIEHPDSCIREISEGTGLQKSSVSARMNELKKDGTGLIHKTCEKEYKGKTVEGWSKV